jgi:hypothetical protein
MRSVISSRLKDNLARASNLVEVYDDFRDKAKGRKTVQSLDILRAATVFLHATLEEFLRGLILWKWPSSPEAVLDRVPLLGHSSSGRPEKFLLGSLAPHRTKTVKELLEECIREHGNSVSFNSTTDVAQILESLGVNVSHVNGRFADLAKLMDRRHHIVHQADRNERAGPGQHKARSIGMTQVNTWIAAVREFGDSVLTEVAS